MDSTAMTTIAWAALKLGAALVVLSLWIQLIRRQIVPLMTPPDSEQRAKRKLPVAKVLGLVFLTILTIWFAQAELAYRDTSGPDRSFENSRSERLEREGEITPDPVPADQHETLQERTARLKEKNRVEGERAKEEFLKNKKPSGGS